MLTHTSPDYLLRLVTQNCQKVRHSAHTVVHLEQFRNKTWFRPLRGLITNHSTWSVLQRRRTTRAQELCEQSVDAINQGQYEHAAYLAINAWGTEMTQGVECCVLIEAPYCLDTRWFKHMVLLRTPIGVIIFVFCLMCGGSGLLSFWGRIKQSVDGSEPKRLRKELRRIQGKLDEALQRQRSANPTSRPSSLVDLASMASPTDRGSAKQQFWETLHAEWLQNSCLRNLPGAKEFSTSTAALFEELVQKFDFQVDSARNQHEHLLSMWRSHCALVADRAIGAGDAVNEDSLLAEALAELHAHLLAGFREWKAKFMKCELANFEDATCVSPSLGGAQWNQLPPSVVGPDQDSGALSRMLAEVVTYLLVWGEAGNLRFMPECVYFITELALAAAPNTGIEDMYGPMGGRGARFLNAIIRPIYNIVFDEWYGEMDLAKDRPKLKDGYTAFLPPDAANYDDWNELFYDPYQLSHGLVLRGGDKMLFESPHSERFALLPSVDWAFSLHHTHTKTHREVHSLWGIFASTHRIWLCHAIVFFLDFFTVAPSIPLEDIEPMIGRTLPVRLASIGLLVPLHSVLWSMARVELVSTALLRRTLGAQCCLRGVAAGILWFLPVVTYVALRYVTFNELSGYYNLAVAVHYFISMVGMVSLLGFSARHLDKLWPATPTALRIHVVRYFFWIIIFGLKYLLGLIIVQAVYQAERKLNLVVLDREDFRDVLTAWSAGSWASGVIQTSLLWMSTFFFFCADTQMWFVVGCTYLGIVVAMVQRGCRAVQFASEDAVSKIPQRFVEKVLSGKWKAFPEIWDRVVEHMHFEDKCHSISKGDMAFSGRNRKPRLFKTSKCGERFAKTYCCLPDPTWPDNSDVQWRLLALARGLGLPMPRPFIAPYFPGLTVLIPHYSESIFLLKDRDLLFGQDQTVPLIDWLTTLFKDEFQLFINRMQRSDRKDNSEASIAGAVSASTMWNDNGTQWDFYKDEEWDKICEWATMRMQTLYRTVAGMCLYHPAIQCHYDANRYEDSALAGKVWDVSDCFTCLISMQRYRAFNPTELEHTNRMFKKLQHVGKSLKVAYIDNTRHVGTATDRTPTAGAYRPPTLHPRQGRRYFSCVFDGTCEMDKEGWRKPKFHVELPGFPILGDGKGDNQNHAIIFTRGTFCQCIDSNQGAYFEQMMLLPCVLGEFRGEAGAAGAGPKTIGGMKQIIGFPEHITSDIGSIGDFAAGSETAFGTILQRSYAALGARMHYGHPDLMQKCWMMQQGGVSKATKTLNLSEDIFAGMDFTLRGEGRTIRHCEYFHLAKGRDLGFNSVLGFFCKLSSGAGEQIITRQMFRLGQLFHLPEALTFYYAHVGYYATQIFVSYSMPLMVFTWLIVLSSDCEGAYRAFENCPEQPAAHTMANLLGTWFSWLMTMFLLITSFPLLFELWMERDFKFAVKRIAKQFLTLSPLHFIFQAKIIGYYVLNELRYGGAQYVNTGRGLPTERRHFVGQPLDRGCGIVGSGGSAQGLYLDYAVHTYYDGIMLFALCLLVIMAGGVSDAGNAAVGLTVTWLSLGLTITSWLCAPFIFNPYMFKMAHYLKDLSAWWGFFFVQDGGQRWVEWYEQKQLKIRHGFRRTVRDVSFLIAFLGLLVVYAVMQQKLRLLSGIFSGMEYIFMLQVFALFPPIGLSLLYCFIVAGVGQTRTLVQSRRSARHLTASSGSDSDSAESASSTDAVHVPRTPSPPLAVSAFMVTFLAILEASTPLYVLWAMNWRKALVVGLLLKLFVFEICLFWAECVLKCKACQKLGCCRKAILLWVHSARLSRDIVTSSTILAILFPFVLLNWINEKLCPGCSFHQLLIYRAPNVQNEEDKLDDEDWDQDDGSSSEDSVSPLRPRG